MSEVAIAPVIPGHTLVRALKSGGFATVYVYRQAVPDREVAVKVLGERFAGDERMSRFYGEANVTASLSTHPNIITIHQAGVTDDGRPYLVMEYCPFQDLADRVKRGPLGVAEVLRIGIRIASAVETAHRARILHRDIKPANILTAAGNRPVLTDFGIAAAFSDVAGIEGLSVPWSPPEVLRDTGNTTRASDVYSLAATLWHLLVGRSPFALPKGPNGQQDLIHRIMTKPVPRTAKEDVPPGLERLLAAAMAKDPADRPTSAMEFARSLLQVAGQAGHAETPIEILDLTESEVREVLVEDDDDPGTRVKRMVTVHPDAAAQHEEDDRTSIRVESPRPTSGLTVLPRREHVDEPTTSRLAGRPEVEKTEVRLRPPVPPDVVPSPEPDQGGRRRAVLLGVAGLVVAGGVATALVLNGTEDGDPGNASPTTTGPVDDTPAVVDIVPAPTELTGARQPDGTVVFSWGSPQPADGDRWRVVRVDGGADDAPQLTAQPTFRVPGVRAGAQVCIEVALRRSDGRTSAVPAEVCAG